MFIMPGLIGARGKYITTYLDKQNVTVGSNTYQNPLNSSELITESGFGASSGGTISDGTSNIYSGASIISLYYTDNYNVISGDTKDMYLIFAVSGSQPNSGWSTMKVGNTTYNRTDASFNFSTWTWDLMNLEIPGSPFGDIGSIVEVIWN